MSADFVDSSLLSEPSGDLPHFSLIFARTAEGIFGYADPLKHSPYRSGLPWDYPEDLSWFSQVTRSPTPFRVSDYDPEWRSRKSDPSEGLSALWQTLRENVLIMGRATYLTMDRVLQADKRTGERRLARRKIITLSSRFEGQDAELSPNVSVAGSLPKALRMARQKSPEGQIFLIGGREVLRWGLSQPQLLDHVYESTVVLPYGVSDDEKKATAAPEFLHFHARIPDCQSTRTHPDQVSRVSIQSADLSPQVSVRVYSFPQTRETQVFCLQEAGQSEPARAYASALEQEVRVQKRVPEFEPHSGQCPAVPDPHLARAEIVKAELERRAGRGPITSRETKTVEIKTIVDPPSVNRTGEHQYLDLLRQVLTQGEERTDRTGVGTLSVFSPTQICSYDLETEGFPLFTTKRVHFQSVVEELLWFLRGETNVKELQSRGVKIWDGNSTPEFLAKQKLAGWEVKNAAGERSFWPPGELGPIYGASFRRFGDPRIHVPPSERIALPDLLRSRAESTDNRDFGFFVCLCVSAISSACALLTGFTTSEGELQVPTRMAWLNLALSLAAVVANVYLPSGGALGFRPSLALQKGSSLGQPHSAVDQIETLLRGLKSDPYSRRHLLILFNPLVLDRVALPPCHVLVQFYVRKSLNRPVEPDRLDCLFYMRSNDLFLGAPFNVASYALLTHLVAQMTGLRPGRLYHHVGDAHLYQTHLDAVRTQLEREPRPFPRLRVLRTPARIEEFTAADLELTGYDPAPSILAKMAV